MKFFRTDGRSPGPASGVASVVLLVVLLGSWPRSASAQLDSPAPPDDPASAMYTLEDIFDHLATGAAGVKRGVGFVEPTSGPAATGRTLDEVLSMCPVADNASGALPGEVLAGRTYWSLRTDGTWGMQTGTVATQTLSDATTAVAAGFYAATDLATVDADLAPGNVASGVDLFGVAGDPNVVNTASGNAVAADIANGRIAWVDGVEVTGTQGGCTGTLNGTRWCDNGDGTVTDLTTGLVWLKDATCVGQWSWYESWATRFPMPRRVRAISSMAPRRSLEATAP